MIAHPLRLLPCCPRSALDELAGRGGRGPEDDPLRLSARGLVQFLRARIREKSLSAAPADLLPASVICQVCRMQSTFEWQFHVSRRFDSSLRRRELCFRGMLATGLRLQQHEPWSYTIGSYAARGLGVTATLAALMHVHLGPGALSLSILSQ